MNGVLWVVRSVMRWEDLPEARYGKYKSVHKRFASWARAGVWDRVFDDLVADTKNPYTMLDLTIVRAHQQVATDARGAPKTRLWSVPEVTDDQDPPAGQWSGDPVAFRLTAGQAIHKLEGRQAAIVLADKGYDSAAIMGEDRKPWSNGRHPEPK